MDPVDVDPSPFLQKGQVDNAQDQVHHVEIDDEEDLQDGQEAGRRTVIISAQYLAAADNGRNAPPQSQINSRPKTAEESATEYSHDDIEDGADTAGEQQPTDKSAVGTTVRNRGSRKGD
jgi:hypothetical protein